MQIDDKESLLQKTIILERFMKNLQTPFPKTIIELLEPSIVKRLQKEKRGQELKFFFEFHILETPSQHLA